MNDYIEYLSCTNRGQFQTRVNAHVPAMTKFVPRVYKLSSWLQATLTAILSNLLFVSLDSARYLPATQNS